jgi:hypothetical protein
MLSNLILCGVIILIIIMYVIFVYICYVEKAIMYKTYVPPTPPNNTYYPLGKITQLSPQQIANRNAIINEALNAGSS